MTSKERVIATLNHKEPDKVPWGEHHIDSEVYEKVLGRKSLTHAKFEEIKAYWEGRRDEVVEGYKHDIVELTKTLDMDLVTLPFVPSKGYAPTPFKKIDDLTYEDENGNIYKISTITNDLMQEPLNTSFFHYDITKDEIQVMIDDIDALPEPVYDPGNSEYEVIQHVVSELGQTHFLIVAVNGIEWARFGKDEEESWMNLLLYPEICEKIAELQAKQTIRQLKIIAQMGVDGILSGGDLGHTGTMAASPELYRKIIFPWHKKIWEVAKSLNLYVLRHCCGYVMPIIEDLSEVNDAYESIQERAGMDIIKLKEQVGDRLTLWGGILHENIHGMTSKEIREDAYKSFKYVAPGGGFILGSSHSLAVGAKLENIMEIKKCRDEWGIYPIKL